MQKWTHTKVCSLEPWVSSFGKIAFSILKNEENQIKLSEVPLNSGLHDSAKIAFSCPQNAENELTPLNRLFNNSAEIAFRAAKLQKMSSHESMCPWTVGITIRQKSHIRSPKSRKWAHTKLGTMETWVSLLGKNCIFRAKKWRKSHPKQGTLQPFVSQK